MLDYLTVLAGIGILVNLAGYALYIRSIFQGITKPHLFTWLAYVILDGTIFIAQFLEGGGIGAWVTFTSAACNLGIVALALKTGARDITRSDWACFIAALAGIVLWKLTGNALTAVVIITITNTVSLLPTFRKSFARPHEESVTVWIAGIVSFGSSLITLEAFNLTTALFPAGVVLTNTALVSMILVLRRRRTGV